MARFIQFLCVGGAGLLVNLAVSYILTDWAGLWYFFSFLLATTVSWTVIFLANSLITFAGHSKERYGQKYLVFLAGYLIIFCLNSALVYSFTSLMHIYYLLSITLAAVVTSVLTFFFSRRYVYH